MALFDDNSELYNTQHSVPEQSEHSSSEDEPEEKKKRGENREYKYVRHFDTVWINSNERYWFEGAHPFVKTNNGLEAHNRLIKQAHTLRRLLPLPQFLKAAVDIVHAWSDSSEEASTMPPIKPYVYRDAYELSKSGRLWRKLDGQDCFIFASTSSKIKSNEELAAAFEIYTKGNLATFKEFSEIRFKACYRTNPPCILSFQRIIQKKTKIYIVEKHASGDFFTCTCREGSKQKMCKHSVMVSCLPAVGLESYPPDAVSETLAKKKKVGRPSQNAKEAPKKAGRPRLAETQNRHAAAN